VDFPFTRIGSTGAISLLHSPAIDWGNEKNTALGPIFDFAFLSDQALAMAIHNEAICGGQTKATDNSIPWPLVKKKEVLRDHW
jgi:hypothetical protein